MLEVNIGFTFFAAYGCFAVGGFFIAELFYVVLYGGYEHRGCVKFVLEYVKVWFGILKIIVKYNIIMYIYLQYILSQSAHGR